MDISCLISVAKTEREADLNPPAAGSLYAAIKSAIAAKTRQTPLPLDPRESWENKALVPLVLGTLFTISTKIRVG